MQTHLNQLLNSALNARQINLATLS